MKNPTVKQAYDNFWVTCEVGQLCGKHTKLLTQWTKHTMLGTLC
jgi:hypothetical protein